jgi:hypothetical protein
MSFGWRGGCRDGQRRESEAVDGGGAVEGVGSADDWQVDTGRGRIARRLEAAGVPQRLLVRDLGRAPQLTNAEAIVADYSDAAAAISALGGDGVRRRDPASGR